jgi:hypothetical protein
MTPDSEAPQKPVREDKQPWSRPRLKKIDPDTLPEKVKDELDERTPPRG